jgi:hypothetical protein
MKKERRGRKEGKLGARLGPWVWVFEDLGFSLSSSSLLHAVSSFWLAASLSDCIVSHLKRKPEFFML